MLLYHYIKELILIQIILHYCDSIERHILVLMNRRTVMMLKWQKLSKNEIFQVVAPQ